MKEKIIQYIENQYFPCINWFKISNNISYIELSSGERWQKMSFRNRCVIAGSNGLINLSVPIEQGRNQKILFRDVKIDNKGCNWQQQHWRTIVSCYNRSPFFEYYADGLRQFFDRKYIFLFDLDQEIICYLNKYLFDLQIVNDNEFEKKAVALAYCEPKDFQEIPEPVVYRQMFEERIGFQPNLSILDLLFMEGPNAKRLIS